MTEIENEIAAAKLLLRGLMHEMLSQISIKGLHDEEVICRVAHITNSNSMLLFSVSARKTDVNLTVPDLDEAV